MSKYDEDNDYDTPEESTVAELENINSTLEEIHSTLKSRETDFSVGVFVVFLMIVLLEGWPGSKLDRWTDRVWYSYRYDTEFKDVNVNKRPRDCDFFHAPVGGKGCEYEKRTNVFGNEQREALIKLATTPEEQQAYAKQPNSVTVYWEKEQD